ncbi:MAG: hypothetical protein ABW123_12220 [Cystobacter sp.]
MVARLKAVDGGGDKPVKRDEAVAAQVREMAGLWLNRAEIARVVKLSAVELEALYGADYEVGKAAATVNLRVALQRAAMNPKRPNVTALRMLLEERARSEGVPVPSATKLGRPKGIPSTLKGTHKKPASEKPKGLKAQR